jgi:uncharacterized protein
MRRRYLAYGSNMCAGQMARRCPAAQSGDLVELPGWRFAINRRGVATLLPDAGARAVGLVWHLTADCEAALDRHEGVATGHYTREEIDVGGAPALAYIATEARPGMPRPGYLELILAAAETRGVPMEHRAAIAGWGRAVMAWLVTEVLRGYLLPVGGTHGPAHWLRVRTNGLALAARTPGADARVVELFALLHDCRRHDEWEDLGHGERAAHYARQLADEGILRLDSERMELLAEACAGHEHGRTTMDPTIGCCWDADRLELSRLGMRPASRYLSTAAARVPEIQTAAWQRGHGRHAEPEGAAAWGLGIDTA